MLQPNVTETGKDCSKTFSSDINLPLNQYTAPLLMLLYP